ncbi:MAG: YqaA family protein [Alphaproteobacteria bacterium]
MLQRLYDWTLRLAAHPQALWWLVAVSFIESSIFPIPPDVLLVPMVLAAPHRAWLYAAACTAASVVGGLAGYGIGWGLYDLVGRQIVSLYSLEDEFRSFTALFAEWGWWLVAFAGFTPFPYKVITIASGLAHLDLATFTGASIVSRGARFFLVAALLWRFGPAIRGFIERRLALLTFLFFALLIGGFLALRLLRH